MIHVIFICTGNICRSAMADGYLKYRLKQLGKQSEVEVTSAGIYADETEKATYYAQGAIAKYGANINSHRATRIENSNVEQADFILVMTERHKKDVISRYPKLKDKVILLGQYHKDKEYKDIDDPWGYSYSVYEKCAKEIVESIEEFIKKEI